MRSLRARRYSLLEVLGFVSTSVLLVYAAAQAALPHAFSPGAVASAQQVNENFDALEARLAALEAKTAPISLDGTELTFTGVNVNVVNGAGGTDGDGGGAYAGLGNLVLGYNESEFDDRTGSHNLVVGAYHSYTGFGGLVAGRNNSTDGFGASVVGGFGGQATENYATICGGWYGTAGGQGATVSGGEFNIASGGFSSVHGGTNDQATGFDSSVLGGDLNVAAGGSAAVVGGLQNSANAEKSAILGGRSNTTLASAHYSAILGGRDNTASLAGTATTAVTIVGDVGRTYADGGLVH